MAEIHRQLRGISSDRVIGLGPNKVMSVPDAIGIAIEKWMQEKNEGVQQDLLAPPSQASVAPRALAVKPPASSAGPLQPESRGQRSEDFFVGACPDCGSQLEFAEGCMKCHVCGYSECG
jgi:ribonucleoside-diphosphate reductase alpha chain